MSCGIDEYKRIKMIDDFFRTGGRATIKDLSIILMVKRHDKEKGFSCGISEKVLYKVLAAMKNELNVPLAKDAQNQYYYDL